MSGRATIPRRQMENHPMIRTMTCLAVTALAAVLAATPASASNLETFVLADLDSDGAVDGREFGNVFPFLELEAMKMADLDLDGVLNRREFVRGELPAAVSSGTASPIGGRMGYEGEVPMPISGQLIELPLIFLEDDLDMLQFRRIENHLED